MGRPAIVAFANQKGGVGKTTSCVNMASAAAAMGKRVLLIDSDAQGNATSGVGISKKNVTCSTAEVLLDGADPAEAVIRTDFENLWVTPATISLAGAEFSLFDEPDRVRRLKAFTDKCDGFDLIMIDCPPSLSLLTVNALTAADGVVIPMQAEYYALEGLSQLMMTIRRVKDTYNPTLCVLGILITMFNGRLNLSSAVVGEIKKYYGDKLFKTMIPRAVKLSEAPSFGRPINYHDKYSRATDAYREVTEELLSRLGLM